jgi:hypothetical protein
MVMRNLWRAEGSTWLSPFDLQHAPFDLQCQNGATLGHFAV